MGDSFMIKLLALVILMLMFVPFAAISCEGEEIIVKTNLGMGLGLDSKVELMGSEEKIEMGFVWPATLVLVTSLLGLVFLIKQPIETKLSHLLALGIYGVMLLSMIILPGVAEEVMVTSNRGDGLSLELTMKLGYYLALVLNAIVVLLLGIASFRECIIYRD